MNLSLADLADLPLAAALVDPRDQVIARTPEWDGPGPGAVTFVVRANRLVVRTRPASADCDALVGRLLDALDSGAGGLDGPAAMRVVMLAASLRLVTGRNPGIDGTTADVLAFARAGITARTALDVRTAGVGTGAVRAPAASALVLVQLAVNAERHHGATSVTLEADGTTIRIAWPGTGAATSAVSARRREDRKRWGLGFARVAADAVGGAVYPPRDCGDGTVAATLELGLRRLTLALALVRGGRLTRSTRSWDEETGLSPAGAGAAGSRLDALVALAVASPGRIVRHQGWSARAVAGAVWAAVPPDDAEARARDLLAGLAHERALCAGLAEPARSRIGGLALLLATLLGDPMPRVPFAAWTARMAGLAGPFGLGGPLPEFEGLGAIDPQVAAMLAADAGDGFEVDGDRLWLRLRVDRRDDPAVRVLLSPGAERIPLG